MNAKAVYLSALLVLALTAGCRSSSKTQVYLPSSAATAGDASATTPNAAMDGDPNTAATCSELAAPIASRTGLCSWSGFPAAVTTRAMTLTVTAAAIDTAQTPWVLSYTTHAGDKVAVSPIIAAGVAAAEKAVYQVTLPSGTDLSQLEVDAFANWSSGPIGNASADNLQIYEISVK